MFLIIDNLCILKKETQSDKLAELISKTQKKKLNSTTRQTTHDRKMLRNVIAIIVCCLSCYQCDNRYNDKYNDLVNRGNLKTKIDSQLPKESKFFDMNDFDCE